MQVTVKLYASFCIGRFNCAVREYPEATTVSAISQDLGLATDALIRLRNGCHAGLDEQVQDRDTVSFLPMIDGG